MVGGSDERRVWQPRQREGQEQRRGGMGSSGEERQEIRLLIR